MKPLTDREAWVLAKYLGREGKRGCWTPGGPVTPVLVADRRVRQEPHGSCPFHARGECHVNLVTPLGRLALSLYNAGVR